MKNGNYIKKLGESWYVMVRYYESKRTMGGAPVVVSEEINSVSSG